MKNHSIFKRLTAICLCLFMAVSLLPVTPVSAANVQAIDANEPEMGSYGVVYFLSESGSGKEILTYYPINSNADANEVISLLNYDLDKISKVRPFPMVHFVLNHDWTTDEFPLNIDFPYLIDLGGHKWTVNGISEYYTMRDHVDDDLKDIAVTNGRMSIGRSMTAPFYVHGDATLTINQVTFENCEFTYGLIHNGARIPSDFTNCSGGSVVLKNVTFRNCCGGNNIGRVVNSGSAVFYGEADNPNRIEFENCLFENCWSKEEGGVASFYGENTRANFKNCRFVNCHSDTEGGVFYVDADQGHYSLENCVALNCYTEADGGFLFVNGDNCTFSGGVISKSGHVLYDDRTVIVGCRADSDGGAICTSTNSGCGNNNMFVGFNFGSCTAGVSHDKDALKEDSSNCWGGAMCLRGTKNVVRDCDFYENYAGAYGGGVFIDGEYCGISDCTFEMNYCVQLKGFDIYVDNDYAVIQTLEVCSSYTQEYSIYQNDAATLNNINFVYLGKKFPEDHFSGGSGAKEDPYIIASGYDIALMAVNVNLGKTYTGLYFVLDNNIRGVYASIGDGSAGRGFKGTFDGRNYTVEFWAADNEQSYRALFGYAAAGATIRNVIVTGSVNSGYSTAGICARAENCLIESCRNCADIGGSSSESGGIVAFANGATIRNCVNIGSVQGSSKSGGIVGYAQNSATVDDCINIGKVTGATFVGGIVGYAEPKCTVKNCLNNASVTGDGWYTRVYIGGICGYVSGVTILNCVNSPNGAITLSPFASAESYAGGLAGAAVNDSYIRNSSNNGPVKTPYGSGIVGAAQDTVLDHCFNAGSIVAGSANHAIIGTQLKNVDVNYCYYAESCGVADPQATKVKRDDCGNWVAKTMNQYIEKKAKKDWTLWTVGGALYGKMATVNVQNIGVDYSLIGSGTVEDPYLLISDASLQVINDALLDGESFKDQYFFLLNNLYSSITSPIGDRDHPFDGFIEGGGHSITINMQGKDYAGLFAALDGATVQNLTIAGTISVGYRGSGTAAGALAAYAENSVIRGCNSSADVSSLEQVYMIKAGGFVGIVNNTTFYNCSNYGSVETDFGICGGIAAEADGATSFNMCENDAMVNGFVCGGIVGMLAGKSTVFNCVNYASGIVQGNECVGGIAGAVSGEGLKSILNCANHGQVIAADSAGGILGYVGDGAELEALCCFTSGKVKKAYDDDPGENMGAFAPPDAEGTYTLCYYYAGQNFADEHATGVTVDEALKTKRGSMRYKIAAEVKKHTDFLEWIVRSDDETDGFPTVMFDPESFFLADEAQKENATAKRAKLVGSVFANGTFQMFIIILVITLVGLGAVTFAVLRRRRQD